MIDKDILLKRAGIPEKTLHNSYSPDPDFTMIMDALKRIHTFKGELYGDYQETHGNQPAMMALIEHHCDMKRKAIRAQNFISKMASGDPVDLDDLLDTYSDLAVYAAMGVQLIFHLKDREGPKNTEKKNHHNSDSWSETARRDWIQRGIQPHSFEHYHRIWKEKIEESK